jgi:filamentous hemagglutinin family protein
MLVVIPKNCYLLLLDCQKWQVVSLTAYSIFVFLCSLVASSPTSAQITPDDTVPTDVTESGDVSEITGGAEAGNNLFHSFEDFSVPTGKEAFFNNAANITNIISRVTGSSVSNIDGLIKANGSANLFLLNPNGIIFGSNASLNIGGSFYATTADSLLFEDDTEFSATNPQTPLLTVSVPLGLQIDSQTGSITNRSVVNDNNGEIVGLQVQPGKNLMLLGGDINVEGGNLTAPGGRIELGGLREVGTVLLNEGGSFSFPQEVLRADVSLDNEAEVNVRASNGGSIAVNAQNLSLNRESSLLTGIKEGSGSATSKAGDIDINATGIVSIADGSLLTNTVRQEATGEGGDINIATKSLFLRNSSRISTSTQEKGKGDAGNIEVNATELIFASANSKIKANTSGGGDAGDTIIHVDNYISFDGAYSGVESLVDETGIGQGGNIYIQARSLSLTNGAVLSTSTFGQGNAGNIRVHTKDSVILSGTAPYPIVYDAIFDEQFLGGSSSGFLTATDIGLQGSASGQGGNIDVTTKKLSLSDGAVLSARTRTDFSGGDIKVNAENLELIRGGQILTTAFGKGDAGNITIDAGNISISGSDPTFDDRLNSITNNFGVDQAQLAIDPVSSNSGIFANSDLDSTGIAGNININVRESLETNGGNILSSSFKSNAGAIDISAGKIRLRNDSNISSVVRQGSGSGGNVKLTADSIVAFDDSDIVTFAQSGSGGDITLDTPAFFGDGYQDSSSITNPLSLNRNNRADVNATGAFNGIITLPDVSFIQNNLATLPQVFLNTNDLIASSCIARRDQQTGSFTITGNDSLPTPSQSDDEAYSTGTVQTIPSPSFDDSDSRPWKKGDPIIEPTGVYRLPNGELVMSRECSQ